MLCKPVWTVAHLYILACQSSILLFVADFQLRRGDDAITVCQAQR